MPDASERPLDPSPPAPGPALTAPAGPRPGALAVRVLLGAAVFTGLAWTLLRQVASPEAADRLGEVSPLGVLLGALVWTVGVGLQGLRWRALFPAGEGVPGRWLAARVIVGANVLNITVPGPVGEVVAAWAVHRRTGAPLPVAVASSFLARIVAVVGMGGVAVVLAPGVGAADSEEGRMVAAGGLLLGAAGLAVGLVCVWPERIAGVGAGFVERVGGARGAKAARLVRRVGGDLAALGRLGPAAWGEAAAWSLASAVVQAAGAWCGLHAAGLPVAPAVALYAHVLNSLGLVAVMFLPAGVGATEAIYVGVLSGLGVADPATALVGAVAVRWVQLGSLLFALPLLIRLGGAPPPAPRAPGAGARA